MQCKLLAPPVEAVNATAICEGNSRCPTSTSSMTSSPSTLTEMFAWSSSRSNLTFTDLQNAGNHQPRERRQG